MGRYCMSSRNQQNDPSKKQDSDSQDLCCFGCNEPRNQVSQIDIQNYFPKKEMLIDRLCFQHVKSQRFWGEWTVQQLRKKFQKQRIGPFAALSAGKSRYINQYDLDKKLRDFPSAQQICKYFKVVRRQRANSDQEAVHRISSLSHRSFNSVRAMSEMDLIGGSHFDLNSILVCLCVMSTSTQQEKAAFLIELLPDQEDFNIDDHVVSAIIEPLVTLALHIIPALVLKIMRDPETQSTRSLCYGQRNLTKTPDIEAFRQFVNRLAKINRIVTETMAESLQANEGDSALYSRIEISKDELMIKLLRMARLFEVWNVARGEMEELIEKQSEIDSVVSGNPLKSMGSIKLDSWRDHNRSVGDILHGLD